jgi:hypothetical protein
MISVGHCKIEEGVLKNCFWWTKQCTIPSLNITLIDIGCTFLESTLNISKLETFSYIFEPLIKIVSL